MGIVAVYSDGGLLSANPSAIGGTWAWCFVGEIGQRLRWESGVVLPSELGCEKVTNNQSELIAAVLGLEAMPDDGECVDWFTDSEVTLWRLTTGKRWANIPGEWKKRALAVRERIDNAVLLAGHPSAAQLRVGMSREKNLPVSIHNRFCDLMCCEEAAKFKRLAAIS